MRPSRLEILDASQPRLDAPSGNTAEGLVDLGLFDIVALALLIPMFLACLSWRLRGRPGSARRQRVKARNKETLKHKRRDTLEARMVALST